MLTALIVRPLLTNSQALTRLQSRMRRRRHRLARGSTGRAMVLARADQAHVKALSSRIATLPTGTDMTANVLSMKALKHHRARVITPRTHMPATEAMEVTVATAATAIQLIAPLRNKPIMIDARKRSGVVPVRREIARSSSLARPTPTPRARKPRPRLPLSDPTGARVAIAPRAGTWPLLVRPVVVLSIPGRRRPAESSST